MGQPWIRSDAKVKPSVSQEVIEANWPKSGPVLATEVIKKNGKTIYKYSLDKKNEKV